MSLSLIKDGINYLFGLGLFANAMLFVPQIIRLIKTKDANGVSLLMLSGFFSLQIISVLHGLVVKDYILSIGFSFSLITCGLTLLLAIFYKNKA